MAEKKQADKSAEPTNTGTYEHYLLPDFQGSGVDVAVKARSPQEAITKAEQKVKAQEEAK